MNSVVREFGYYFANHILAESKFLITGEGLGSLKNSAVPNKLVNGLQIYRLSIY